MTATTVIWRSPTASEPWNQEANLARLAARVLTVGGRALISEARAEVQGTPPPALGDRALTTDDQPVLPDDAAYVDGQRDDLWWEFTLEASFRWQAHLARMRPEVYQSRLRHLTHTLGLEGLLGRQVAGLTHGTRALADLAVALLPAPRLLVWEEPFYLMSEAEAERAVRLVEAENAAGMALVAVARERPGLADLPPVPRWPHGRRLPAAL
ncbi:MAG: hypothetical protein AB2385_10770 [Symbiobacterium sp.]|uniref:hypothetical protein n=1 Tax=Symbiobacterium sp. TaxID=1971213 RepID=UPI0034643DED